MGSEQLWSSIKNESTESVQHQLLVYYSLGHKVYLRLSSIDSHHHNTCHGQNSETKSNCSCRHQAGSIWCHFDHGTWMNLELSLVNYHSTRLVPILADLPLPDNMCAGDHGMRAWLHEQHHCWSWIAICKRCFPSQQQASRWNLPPLTREGVQNSRIRWIAVTKVVLEHVFFPVGPSCVSVIPPKCRPLYLLTMFAFSDRRTLTSVAVILIHRDTCATVSAGYLITCALM